MTHPLPRFCPQCGAALIEAERFGRPRPVCPVCDHTVFVDPKVAVVVLVMSGEDVLLVRRKNDPGCGQWALPGGFMDADEPPEETARREVEEETGVAITSLKFAVLFHRPDPDGLADLVIAYRAEAASGALCAGDDAGDARWVGNEELDGLPVAFYSSRLMLERWRSGELLPQDGG